MELAHAEKIAIQLVKTWLPNWSFKFNNRRTALGVCCYVEKTIYLSKPITLINEEESVVNTIKHEIAHALVGPGHNHDNVWRSMAIKLGCSGRHCGRVKDDTQEAKKIMGVKYQMIISTTGEVIQDYYRKPNEKTLRTISERYVTGRKQETLGKLAIITYKG